MTLCPAHKRDAEGNIGVHRELESGNVSGIRIACTVGIFLLSGDRPTPGDLAI
jgi:hypothetical protein